MHTTSFELETSRTSRWPQFIPISVRLRCDFSNHPKVVVVKAKRKEAHICLRCVNNFQDQHYTVIMHTLDFFKRFTHRGTHVASHRRWLESKGANVLPDWDDAGSLDCMYGAVLKAAQYNNVKLIAPGATRMQYVYFQVGCGRVFYLRYFDNVIPQGMKVMVPCSMHAM